MRVIRRSRPWTVMSASVFVLMLAAAVYAFRTPLADILNVALRDEEQSHILLAPLVIVWLIWLRRSRLRLLGVLPNLLGPLIVLVAAAISWWGFQNDVYIAWHGGAILAIIGMIVSMTGLEPIRQFYAASLAFAFLLPVPGMIRSNIAIPLQSMATSVTHACLEMFGFQAAKSGNLLIINGEQVAVAEACNGMRLVFSLTLVVYAFAFSMPLRPSVRIALIALSPAVALFANVVRLVPTSLMYGLFSADQAAMFHDITGWIMLPVALLALIGLLRLMEWLEVPTQTYRLAGS